MASFSFRAGNVKGLVRIPLYAAGAILSALVPRRPGSWVFGSAVGIADGALALWREVTPADAVWLTHDPRHAATAQALGIRNAPAGGLCGWWRTARAEVIVLTHGFGDVNRYAVSGGFVVQLWHGIPLKRLGLDSAETTRVAIAPDSRVLAAVLRWLYRRAQRRIDLLPAASHLVRGRLESAFGLPTSRVPVTGEPRVDVLSPATTERHQVARDALGEVIGPVPDGTRLLLYAPTWRDGDEDPAVPTPADWALILEVLTAQDAILVVRSHPLGRGDYTPPQPSDRIRTLPSSVVADVTPLLAGFDVLITDFSSLLYDVSLIPLPVLFFAPDLDRYDAQHGIYGSYADVATTGWATTWEDLSARLGKVLSDADSFASDVAASAARSARVHAFRDGGNTARVAAAIRAALDRSRDRHRREVRR